MNQYICIFILLLYACSGIEIIYAQSTVSSDNLGTEDQDENIRINNLAAEDVYHAGMVLTFFNPPLESKNEVFNSSIKLSYIYSYKRRLTDFDQIGLNILPLSFALHTLDTDAIRSGENRMKERYFGVYVSVGLYNRLILSKKKKTGKLGSFVDIGIGYDLPLLYRYSYFSEPTHKHLIKKVHRLNEFRSFLRIGFSDISIKAEYRLTEIMKDSFWEPPKLNIGIEISYESVFD